MQGEKESSETRIKATEVRGRTFWEELTVMLARTHNPGDWGGERSEEPEATKREPLRTDHCPALGDGGHICLDIRKEHYN